MVLSLLIPTIEARHLMFAQLLDELQAQIRASRRPGDVEVIHCLDNGAESIATKRNRLVDRASGRFVAFIDDDDQVSTD
jgi:glycosyltransferase involved in cell wall biosynthesis